VRFINIACGILLKHGVLWCFTATYHYYNHHEVPEYILLIELFQKFVDESREDWRKYMLLSDILKIRGGEI
jgi:hypothetical protein